MSFIISNSIYYLGGITIPIALIHRSCHAIIRSSIEFHCRESSLRFFPACCLWHKEVASINILHWCRYKIPFVALHFFLHESLIIYKVWLIEQLCLRLEEYLVAEITMESLTLKRSFSVCRMVVRVGSIVVP